MSKADKICNFLEHIQNQELAHRKNELATVRTECENRILTLMNYYTTSDLKTAWENFLWDDCTKGKVTVENFLSLGKTDSQAKGFIQYMLEKQFVVVKTDEDLLNKIVQLGTVGENGNEAGE